MRARVDVGLLADEDVLGPGVQVAEGALEPGALADGRGTGGQVGPLAPPRRLASVA